MQRLLCNVLDNVEVADGYHELSFSYSGPEFPQAGQFLTIRVGEGIAPLLRRPFAFSFLDRSGRNARIIYERRGNATALMSGLGPGDSLDILAPLGNFFPLPRTRPVLVGGGVGMGPLFYLFDDFRKEGLDPIFVIGARNSGKIPDSLLPPATLVCTDDGSRGVHGTVIAGLEQLDRETLANAEYYLCGPNIMMKAVQKWLVSKAQAFGRKPICWASMEQTMGCAVGACMGCVVKVHSEKKFARVCTEGPVFDAEKINWE